MAVQVLNIIFDASQQFSFLIVNATQPPLKHCVKLLFLESQHIYVVAEQLYTWLMGLV